MELLMRRVTLTQFLIEQQRAGRMTADLRLLLEVVARAAKAISVDLPAPLGPITAIRSPGARVRETDCRASTGLSG